MIIQHHRNTAARTCRPSREYTRSYTCPKCNAATGQPCTNPRGGHRIENHIERVRAATSLINPAGPGVGEISPLALAFTDGYLLSWKRDPAAARLTPQEFEAGAQALKSMGSGRVFLETCHKNDGSMDGMAARWNRPLRMIANRYVEAVWELAANATPLLETCCQSCLRQMPDVIFDSTLRCPGCLALLQDFNKPVPNALDVEELKANCAVLRTTWTAPTYEIEVAYEKQLKLWNHVIESNTWRGEQHRHAEEARKKGNEAWAFIKSYRGKYGYGN